MSSGYFAELAKGSGASRVALPQHFQSRVQLSRRNTQKLMKCHCADCQKGSCELLFNSFRITIKRCGDSSISATTRNRR